MFKLGGADLPDSEYKYNVKINKQEPIFPGILCNDPYKKFYPQDYLNIDSIKEIGFDEEKVI